MRVLERSIDDTRQVAVIVHVLSDLTCGPRDLRVDQTVRIALGLPPRVASDDVIRDDLRLLPLGVSVIDRVRDGVSRLIGCRYVLLRAAPPRPPDIEKRICRLSADDLHAIGSPKGGVVVLYGAKRGGDGGYTLGRSTLQALALESDVVREREATERSSASEGWNARYVCPEVVLGVEGDDLAKIFIDSDNRMEIGVEQAWPVLVRRDSRSAFSRAALEFGVAVLASLLALEGVVQPILSDQGWGPLVTGTVVVVLALVGATALIGARLRSDLR